MKRGYAVIALGALLALTSACGQKNAPMEQARSEQTPEYDYSGDVPTRMLLITELGGTPLFGEQTGEQDEISKRLYE